MRHSVWRRHEDWFLGGWRLIDELAFQAEDRHSYAVRVLEAMEAMPGLERPTEIA